ncbi:MAG: glycosyltransferase family 39 protein [Nanoarchaeota archaeon]|nr:glycosyltransferase family 39 protein [Nanoarchaeota archaeon]
MENSSESNEIIEQRKNKFKDKISSWFKDPYTRVFILILIAAFVIRFLIFLKTMNQPLWYDGASYLATAKQWGLGLNLLDIWYYRRGFLFPLICAFLFKLGFGETGIRFVAVLFSTGLVLVTYLLISEMFNKKISLYVSIGMVLSWTILFFTGRTLTEIPAAFFLLTATLFFWKGYVKNQGNKYIYLFGLFLALAALTRMQSLMFAPAFLVYAFTKEKFKFVKNKQLWISIAIFALVLLPLLFLYWGHFGNPVTDIMAHYFGFGKQGIEQTAADQRSFSTMLDYFKNLPYILSADKFPIIFILFILGIFIFFSDLVLGFDKIFQNQELQKKLFILVWIVASFLILGRITDYVEQRYVIPCLPFLFLIALSPIMTLENMSEKFIKSKKVAGFIIFVLVIFLFYSNYTFGNGLIDNKLTSYAEVKEAGLWLKQNSNPQDIVITASMPQIQYYSERSSYDFGVNESDFEINRLEKLNPRFFILSVFESHPQWVLEYPQNHQDLLVPVQAYSQTIQGQQSPVLVIYEFNRSVSG